MDVDNDVQKLLILETIIIQIEAITVSLTNEENRKIILFTPHRIQTGIGTKTLTLTEIKKRTNDRQYVQHCKKILSRKNSAQSKFGGQLPKQQQQKNNNLLQKGSTPGIEPGTSSTLRKNHAPRPSGLKCEAEFINFSFLASKLFYSHNRVNRDDSY